MLRTLFPDEANAQMLTLARVSRAKTQAEVAKALGIGQGTLSKMESGVLPVSEEVLEELPRVLGYPRSFYFRQDSIDGPSIVELYHARKRKTVSSTLLNRAYALASIRRSHVEALLRSVDQEPGGRAFPLYPAEEYGDPVKVARTVRAHMELAPGPVFSVTAAVESAGGYIIECDFDSRMIDGFTKWRHPLLPPLFFMNRDLAPDRWRWTLAHELGHAVMHTNQDPSEDLEQEANDFAQEFLMPRQQIKHQLVGLNFSKLAGLKRYWKVSMQALIEYAHKLQVLSPRQRTAMYQQLNRAGYKTEEPRDLDPPAEPPQALRNLVVHHLRDLNYTARELAAALNLLEEEFCAYYMPDSPALHVVR